MYLISLICPILGFKNIKFIVTPPDLNYLYLNYI